MKQDIYAKAFSEAILPDPLLSVSDWAAKYRVLTSDTSAEPGPWRNERTPYLTEVMDSLSPFNPVQHVVVIKGTQQGFTEGGVNMVGYVIDSWPGPVLYVMDTDSKARMLSKTKFKALFDTPRLRDKLPPKRSRDASSSMLEREFAGGFFRLTGANSSSGLRSYSAKVVIIDEVDAYPVDVDGEGDPTKLAKARADSFYNRKIFEFSTPGELETSRITVSYERSDMREYHVVCPECGGLQILKWENLKFEHNDEHQLIEEPYYVCEHCGCRLEEHRKTWMMATENGAKWIPTRESKIRGYRINSLYSPLGWLSWRQIAQEFLDASLELKRGNVQPMKAWQTTRMAKAWAGANADSRGEETILRLCDDRPRGLVPSAADVLIMSVDTQKWGFWYVIRAWQFGAERNSWLVREGFVESFDALLEIADGHYEDVHKTAYKVRLRVIDSGGGRADSGVSRTAEVYDFCSRHRGWVPVKGSSGQMRAPLRYSNLEHFPGTNKAIPGGLTLLMLDTAYFKDFLSGKLGVVPGDPGAYMLHSETTKEYAGQMLAEYKDDHGDWVCRAGRDNHYWDCEIYNLAAAEAAGLVNKKRESVQQSAPAPDVVSPGWMSGGRRSW